MDGRRGVEAMETDAGRKDRSIEVSLTERFNLGTPIDPDFKFFSILVILPVRLEIVLDISSIFFKSCSTSVLVARDLFICAV
jgi:hypothetical protein